VKRYALACVLTLLLVACAGSGERDANADPRGELNELQAAALIRTHESFRRPLTVALLSTLDSPTAAQLAETGYLRRTDEPRVKYRMTDKGRTNGFEIREFEIGIPIYVAAVAELELVRVTSIDAAPMQATERVSFVYRRAPTVVGRDLLTVGSDLRELHTGEEVEGTAEVALHDDGWRVSALSL